MGLPNRTEGGQARDAQARPRCVKSPTFIPAMYEVATPLPLLSLFRHPAAAEALLQRQAEAQVPVALAELVDDLFRSQAVRKEAQAVPVPACFERIVDVE